MPRLCSEARLRSAVGWIAVVLAITAVWTAPAHSQGDVEQIQVELGTIGMSTLSTIYPSMVYRPFDDMTVRPGGQAMGMGGAYLARAEGPLAVGWEPAGLAALTRTAFVADGYSGSSTGAVPDYPDSFIVPQSPPLLLSSYSVDLKGGLKANFLAAGTPLWTHGRQRLVGAVSWRRYHDVAMPEATVSDLAFGNERGFPVVITNDRSEKGAVESFAPSLALQVFPGLALGANLNFLTGRLHSDAKQRLATGGQPFEATTRLTFKYSGFVPDFGLRLTSPGDRVQVGLLYSPGYTLKVRGGDLFSESLPAPTVPQYITHARIPGYDMKVPSAIGAGIALQTGSRLVLEADMNSRKWSEVTIKYTEAPQDPVSAATNKLPFRDVTSVHFGAEYLLLRPSWGEIPVRFGFRTAPQSFAQVSRSDVVADTTDFGILVSPSGEYNGDQVDGNAYSFGTSLRAGDTEFDLGLDFVSYKFQKWFFDTPYDPIVNRNMTLVTIDRKIRRLRLSATQRF